MRRRDFIKVIGGTAATWPLAACTQQDALPVIGFLNGGSLDGYAAHVAAFHQGLGEAGYVEGRNVAIEYRWAEGQSDRVPVLVADLVGRKVAVIVANFPAVLAAKAATSTIPIVFSVGSDPVKVGLVASLNRPGGNLTGVANLGVDIGPKQLALMHELIPTATTMALLVNPARPFSEALSRDMQAAARTRGLQLHVLHASTERDFDDAFAALAQLRVGALLIGPDPFFTGRSEQLAALTIRHAVPAIYQWREFAAAGGLMSFGTRLTDAYRLVGVYTGRILKGEKPADLPVQQVLKLELIINLKTAKTLGLAVPHSLQVAADEVIE